MDDVASHRPVPLPQSRRLAPSRLARALRVDTLPRQILACVTVGWLPLVIFGAATRLFRGTADPLLLDPATHVRSLVALPILLLAEHDFDLRCRSAIRRLDEQGYLGNGDRRTLAAVVDSAARCRDALLAELLLIAAAYAGSIAVVFGAAVDSPPAAALTAARSWYALCALPLYQLLVFRGLWRWMWWARVLVGLSRLRLRLSVTHPDRRGGIGFLKTPSLRFFALFQLALSCTFSAMWATRLSTGMISVDTIESLVAIYVCIGLVLACAPLLLFAPRLDRLAHEGGFAFGGLTVDYAERFEARWMDAARRPAPLGDPDFQSLADLGNSYRATVERIRRSLVNSHDVLLLLVFAVAPLVPLALLRVPFAQLVSELFRVALGHK